MTADPLLARLEGVIGRGPHWRAGCPSCGGSNRTKLSVREEPDGRLLLHCFGGCSAADIVGAMGLELSDLFPPRPTPDEFRAPRIRKPWRTADVVAALRGELLVAWILLADIRAGNSPSADDRERAGVALERIAHLMDELENAR